MDEFLLHQVNQCGGEVLHARVASLDDVQEFALAAFQDVFLHSRGVDQNLQCWNTRNVRMQRRQELLINDGTQVVGQQLANLLALVHWEQVINTTKRLPCTGCVDGSKHQVAGFGSTHGGFKRFVVAHFTHQRDIRIFTNQRAQCIIEIDAINADFALIDGGFVVLEDVLDRIFNGHDVHLAAFVDVLQHGRDRSGLTTTGDAGKEHQALRKKRYLAKAGRKVQVFKLLDVAGDKTRCDRNFAARHEHVHAEAVLVVVVVSKVHRALVAENFLLPGVENILGHLEHEFLGDDIGLNVLQDTAMADARLQVRLHNKVAPAELNDRGEPKGPGLHPVAGLHAAALELDRAGEVLLSVVA